MPIYKNISSKPIFLEYDEILLEPGNQVETKHFYNKDGLELISVYPYIAPVDESKEIIIPSKTKSYEIDILNTDAVILLPYNNDIKVYFNEYSSSGKFILVKKASEFKIRNNLKYIWKLIIVPVNTFIDTKIYLMKLNKWYDYFIVKE